MKLAVVSDGTPTGWIVIDSNTGGEVEGVVSVSLTCERDKPTIGTIVISGIGIDVQAEIRRLTSN